MSSQSLLSVQAALQEILLRAETLPPRRASIDDALGLVLAEDVHSDENLPPFPNSAMDGFAVRADDVATASREAPVRLKVIAEAPAGSITRCEVIPGSAVKIMTGAVLPPGTEAVVPVEQTSSSAQEVQIFRSIRKGENLRMAGEDVHSGELILAKGSPLRAAEIGLLAAIGRVQVPVFPSPRVAVITTGTELVDAAEKPGPGLIRDANIHALCAQVRATGASAIPFPRISDRKDLLESALHQALAASDVLITNGGISAGDYDFMEEILERLGAVKVFSQVNQKPGRPLVFWMFQGKPVFGLPGNPVAAMVCFEMYVRPALRRMMGQSLLFRPCAEGVLAEAYQKGGKDRRTHWLRVHARRDASGWVATSTGPQGSGILSSMTKANAIAEIPESAASLEMGATVKLHLIDLPEDHGCS
jgi:molybdopterin molybdotransferase